MELKTKFDVGQKAYVVCNHSTFAQEICSICDGIGTVAMVSLLSDIKASRRHTYICPACFGNKFTYSKPVKNYKVEEKLINGIKISIREKSGVHISYKVKSGNSKGESSYPECKNMIFATEQEAVAVCENLNKEYTWYNRNNYPETYRDIIVMDKNGVEHDRHKWTGHAYYRFVCDEDGTCDGYRSDIDITKWRYKD